MCIVIFENELGFDLEKKIIEKNVLNNNYSLRWRWIVVDICQALKWQGKYSLTPRWIIVLVYTTQVE